MENIFRLRHLHKTEILGYYSGLTHDGRNFLRSFFNSVKDEEGGGVTQALMKAGNQSGALGQPSL